MTASHPTDSRARRPQWRGDRKAVLVRMPVEVAHRLSCSAQQSDQSISEHAAELLAAALDPDDAA